MPLQTLKAVLREEEEAGNGAFDPEQITVMTTAFEQLRSDLGLADRDDPVVRMLAKLILELVRRGEMHPHKIRQSILGPSWRSRGT